MWYFSSGDSQSPIHATVPFSSAPSFSVFTICREKIDKIHSIRNIQSHGAQFFEYSTNSLSKLTGLCQYFRRLGRWVDDSMILDLHDMKWLKMICWRQEQIQDVYNQIAIKKTWNTITCAIYCFDILYSVCCTEIW